MQTHWCPWDNSCRYRQIRASHIGRTTDSFATARDTTISLSPAHYLTGIHTIGAGTTSSYITTAFYDHWSQYDYDTAFSVNNGASATIKGVKIAASFSAEYELIKKHQLDDKSFTTKV
uniref:Uncharacterized protein n=1 Tax=Magallana gigas TaxID=29159 RepID=K1Q548_MAGGI